LNILQDCRGNPAAAPNL